MILIVVLIMFTLAALAGGWLAYKNSRPTPFNSIIFIHPDHIAIKPEEPKLLGYGEKPQKQKELDRISTARVATLQPDGTKLPMYYNYGWYYFGLKPLWWWYEEKVEAKDGNPCSVEYIVKPWEPGNPLDFDIRKDMKAEIEDESHRKPKVTDVAYVTPNALFDNTDWECARRFETVKNKLGEAIKVGVAVVMAIACIVGIFLLASTVSQNKQSPVITPPQQQQHSQLPVYHLGVF